MLMTFIVLLVYATILPCAGMLADKIGVVRQIKIAALLYLLFSYEVFAILPKLNSLSCIMVLIFFALIQAFLNSALPVFIVTQFQLNERGKALAISYNISLTVFGGLMPYFIVTSGNYLNPGIPISICAALCFISIHCIRKKYGYLRSELSY